MGNKKDRLPSGWSGILKEESWSNDLDGPTVIDALGDQLTEAIAAAQAEENAEAGDSSLDRTTSRDHEPAHVEPSDDEATNDEPSRPAAASPAPARRNPAPTGDMPPPSSVEPPTTFAPQRQTSAVSVRPVPVAERRHRETTHIDLASALGVGPTPPVESYEPEPPPSAHPQAPLLASASLPRVLGDLKKDQERIRPTHPLKSSPDPGEMRRAAATTEAVSRVVPIVLVVFLIIASGVVAALLLSGRTAPQEHIELRFLTLRGRPIAASSAAEPSRVSITTVPPGLLVVHGREILGKTPLNVDLPLRLPTRVGVELAGPYYDRWVGEITPDDAGTYRVQVELRRKP